jgi:hypothetical protein
MKKFLMILIIIAGIILSSCESISTISNNNIVSTPNTDNILTPEPGKSIIYGTLISESKLPQEGVVVRLARVYGGENKSGAYVLDDVNSPKSISDENGEYYFLNILPGEYVLFVGELDSNYKLISNLDQTPIIYSVTSEEILEIDPIMIEFE